VQEAVTQEKQVMQETLRKTDRFGVTTDLRAQEEISTPYITVTLHFIDDDWNLVARILSLPR